jgi:SAM-dependent methyltransferase
MTNSDQIAHWDGAGGDHWAAEADRYDRMNSGFADRVVEAVQPRAGESFLDAGCGNGALTLAIAALVGAQGHVTAVDLSRAMLAVARRRAAETGVANVTFVNEDVQTSSLPDATYDAIVSRFGVMFFDDPTAAFTNLTRMLKVGGRMAFACWRDLIHNEWLLVPAGAALQHVPMPDLGSPGTPGPFSLADRDTIRRVLSEAGLVDVEIAEVLLPMWMGTSVDDAVEFMRRTELGTTLMGGVDADTAAAAWDAVRSALEAHRTDRGVHLDGSAWVVTARKW